jgi:hypothetical protein
VNHTTACNSTLNQAPSNDACTFPIFDYLKSLDCDASQWYGYHSGNPCVLLKVNNV